MTKKYKCRLTYSSYLFNIDGKVIRVEFKRDIINDAGAYGCSFSTDNKKVQEAIEHSAFFNKDMSDGIWTDDVEEKPVVRKGKAKKEA